MTGGGGANIVTGPMAAQRSKVQQELASIRDTVESIWVAIVLAFVLRAFVVEAFVIPTGSMAPRLLGEHLQIRCPACGYDYAFGWSKESAARADSSERGWLPSASGQPKETPSGAHCPNCTFDPKSVLPPEYPSGGDRVLVMKYLYRFRPPQPWDVIVFKNPQDNTQNYIKRLIGLPGETIELVHGDVFHDDGDGKGFRIRRKDDWRVQEAMYQVVFDNDYRPNLALFERYNRSYDRGERQDFPPAWGPVQEGDKRWDLSGDGGRHFAFKGGGGEGEAMLRLACENDDAQRRLFLPNYGYNHPFSPRNPSWDPSVDVVSDLKLAVVFVPKAAGSRMSLEIRSFEHTFRGELGADGTARLVCRPTFPDGRRSVWGPARLKPLELGRGCRVALANVDLRVTLWVNGEPVLHSPDRVAGSPPGDPNTYPLDYELLKARVERAEIEGPGRMPIPTPEVRVGASGGDCELDHVRVLRDVYYTSPRIANAPPSGPDGDFARALGVTPGQKGWGTFGNPITLAKFPAHDDLDQFFVLGDNSPSSLDGRLWVSAAVTLRLYDEADSLGDPNLAVGDVEDWAAFLAALQAQAGQVGASPGKQLWSMLGEPTRQRVAELRGRQPPEGLAEELTAELNRIMRHEQLYRPTGVWASAASRMPPAAAELARLAGRGEKLSPEQRLKLNRSALEAAFPNDVKRRWRIYQLGTVPRYSLIGKAALVYWPAGFRLPGLPGLPIIPNVGRMRLIR